MLTTGQSVVERFCREDEGVCLLQTTEDKRHKRQLMAVRPGNLNFCIIMFSFILYFITARALCESYFCISSFGRLIRFVSVVYVKYTPSTQRLIRSKI